MGQLWSSNASIVVSTVVSKAPPQRRDCLLVAAIYFGTTYSGYAHSFSNDFKTVYTKIWSSRSCLPHKAPTCILIEKDGKTARAFGYDAELQYAMAKERDRLYLFKQFKMLLDVETGLHRNVMVEDVLGKTLPAMTVFCLSIRWLKEDLETTMKKKYEGKIKPSDIHWVLTVPAIWNDAAKQFMREAAIQAGIPGEKLTIALEPEAAALYCMNLPRTSFVKEYVELSKLQRGTQYMVLNAGGRTVDITIHEVVDMRTVKEIEAVSGGPWGGLTVNNKFDEFLETITGPGFRAKLKEVAYEDEIEVVEAFEFQKRNASSCETKVLTIRLPVSVFDQICQQLYGEDFSERLNKANLGEKVSLTQDKLHLQADIWKPFFTFALENIISHIKQLLKSPKVKNWKYIIMVGGFSECTLLQDAVRTAFPDRKVIIPDEAGLAVEKGAVFFGHCPDAIFERISRCTYGIEEVNEVNDFDNIDNRNKFCPLVRAGDITTVGQLSKTLDLSPQLNNATHMEINLFACKDDPPEFVTDDSCVNVGNIIVPLGKSNEKKHVQVQMRFGETQLHVQCEDKTTGKVTMGSINFLN